MTQQALPLAGVRVLDLSRVLAGPMCCQVLGDLGADVVKVERPGRGDDTRQWGPPFVDGGGPSAYYLACNRNKRGIALDLENPADRETLTQLIGAADVLVENFLPEAIERFGLSHEQLHALNPRLVVASISGYGRTGPMADTPGYDLAVQAAAGIMSITGERDGAPMKVGVAISDVITGLYAAVSVLAGLHARDNQAEDGPGKGAAFDLALADCTLASLVNVAQSALITGERPRRWGNAHPQIVPYEAFGTSDGHLVLAVGNDGQWQRFCQAAERDELADDERFTTNPLRVEHRVALVALLAPLIAARTTDEWTALLTGHGVPHARVTPIDEVVQAPQTIARGMVRTMRDSAGRAYRLLGSPIHWDGAEDGLLPAAAPPELGADHAAVLADWLGRGE
jgi:crotonobetainyl-CoA:carnitine CoA-transferase CaiB-like acyl-CoA transferase